MSSKARYVETVGGTIDELRRLDAERHRTTVPGSPAWTVLDVVRHLSGVASDVVTGRLDGAPSRAWTARHVDERRGRSAGQLFEDVVADVAAVPAAVCELKGGNPYWDAVVHAADIREALRLPKLPEQLWQPVLADVVAMLAPRYDAGGQLTVRTGSGNSVLGSGGPTAGAATTDYELFRALFSRRSRAQIAAWPWSGDPGAHLAALPLFGERQDDQPIPVT